MARERKSTVLRPKSGVNGDRGSRSSADAEPPVDESRAGASLRPGGSPIKASDSVVEVAKKYARLRAAGDRLAEETAANGRELALLEEWLLEQMGEDVQNMNVSVEVPDEGGGLRVRAFTIYQRRDANVWKATGVDTPTLIEALRAVGWGDIVSETYNQRTMKATVCEVRRRRAEGIDADAGRWYCPRCSSFYSDESFTTGVGSGPPACGRCSDPLNDSFVTLVEIGDDGLPKRLAEVLFVEDVKRLGCRRA